MIAAACTKSANIEGTVIVPAECFVNEMDEYFFVEVHRSKVFFTFLRSRTFTFLRSRSPSDE